MAKDKEAFKANHTKRESFSSGQALIIDAINALLDEPKRKRYIINNLITELVELHFINARNYNELYKADDEKFCKIIEGMANKLVFNRLEKVYFRKKFTFPGYEITALVPTGIQIKRIANT